MKTFWYDACSLIYLTKIQIKEKLSELGQACVSPTVKEELLQDIDKFKDAQILDKNFKSHIIRTPVNITAQLPINSSIGKGELETIETCLINGQEIVTDDRQAFNYALTRGIKPKTSEFILIEFLKEKIITLDEFHEKFAQLANIKLLKPNVVDFFNNMAETINQKDQVETDN